MKNILKLTAANIKRILNNSFTKTRKVATIMGVPIYIHTSLFIVFYLGVLAAAFHPGGIVDAPGVTPHVILDYVIFVAVVAVVCFAYLCLIYGSVFLHELGHLYYVRKYNLPVDKIVMHLFGAAALLREDFPFDQPKKEFSTAIAGPAVSSVLVIASALLQYWSKTPDFIRSAGDVLFWVNSLVLLLNVAPCYPLDGGRMLRSVLLTKFKEKTALKATYIISAVLLLIGAILVFFDFGIFGFLKGRYGIFVFFSLFLLINVKNLLELDNSFKQRFSEGFTDSLDKLKTVLLVENDNEVVLDCIKQMEDRVKEKGFFILCDSLAYIVDDQRAYPFKICPGCSLKKTHCNRYENNLKRIKINLNPKDTPHVKSQIA